MATVVHQVGVEPRTVGQLARKEVSQFGLEGAEGQPTGGEVTAEDFYHVVEEETLHSVQEANGAAVHLLHAGCRDEDW